MTRIAIVVLSVAAMSCATPPPPPNMSPVERDIWLKRVSLGMTPMEVYRSWEEPCEKATTTTAEGETEVWTYCAICPKTQVMLGTSRGKEPTCGGRRVVTFKDRKVIQVQQ
jgi:hypothetical protein